MLRPVLRAVAWLHARRGKINKLVLKGVGIYFGYRILHHEIYEAEQAEPILIGLGLWLCGVPVASFFDGLKKMGAAASSAVETVTRPEQEAAKTELKLVEKPQAGENGTT